MSSLRVLYNEQAFFTVLFSDDLWEELKKHMFPNQKSSNFYNYKSGDLAALHGYFGLIFLRNDLVYTKDAVDNACANGHLDVAQYLYYSRTEGCTYWALNRSAGNGHLEVVKWLCLTIRIQDNGPKEGDLMCPIDYAADDGHLEVIKFLHENNIGICTKYAIDNAASNGHLPVVKFLHENRTEGCTVDAMNYAASNGYLSVVKFLHENKIGICTKDAIDGAAEDGHLEVVKFLFHKRKEGYTRAAINGAIMNDHLPIIEFFVFKGGDVHYMIMTAIAHKQVHILKYLFENGGKRGEPFPTYMMERYLCSYAKDVLLGEESEFKSYCVSVLNGNN